MFSSRIQRASAVVLALVLIGIVVLPLGTHALWANQGAASGVTVQYRPGSTDPADTRIAPVIQIVNSGPEPLQLSDLSLRYWYTRDGDQPQMYTCEAAALGCDKIGAQIISLSAADPGADTYLELTFAPDAGTLAPGTSSGEILGKIERQDATAFDEQNDYSFSGTDIGLVDSDRVTLYYRGALVWGTEPNGTTPVPREESPIAEAPTAPPPADDPAAAPYPAPEAPQAPAPEAPQAPAPEAPQAPAPEAPQAPAPEAPQAPAPEAPQAPAPEAPPTDAPPSEAVQAATWSFYRAVNLNGPALTIDGQAWGGSNSPDYVAEGWTFCDPSIPLTPATDPTRADMLRCSLWGNAPQVRFSALPPGSYQVYLYVWEDNWPQTFSVLLNGQVVQPNVSSGSAGTWQRLGPWTAAVTDGTLTLATSGEHANLSGIELWSGTSGAPMPPTATSVPPTATATSVPPTATSVPPTATSVPPTATATSVPPTATSVPPTATATSVPPTATSVPPTATSVPPTATSVPPTATSVPPTATSVPPTATSVPPTATATRTAVPATATATSPPTAATSNFYRAINLNGPALTIDGRAWSADTSAGLTVEGGRFCDPSIPLTPATDPARADMLRCSLWGNAPQVRLSALPPGSYQVYLYVWEDNWPQTFSVLLNGQVVQPNVSSGSAGTWQRLGPWTAAVTDGTLTLATSGEHANLSGIELWSAPTGAPRPPTATVLRTVVPATATATRTALPATATATRTALPATATATRTALPATATATRTALPATATATRTALPATATATRTALPATATSVVAATATSTTIPTLPPVDGQVDVPPLPGVAADGLQVLSSELSPAILASSSRTQMTFFANMQRWSLGAPLHVAYQTSQGVRVRHRGASETLAIAPGDLREPWMLVWFRGAAGWQWDSPWLVVWQRRPAQISLGPQGLRASASQPLGYVALLPLYGSYKPDTSGWDRLPDAVVARARFWSRVVRAYPLSLSETFRLDPAQDAVVVRNTVRYHLTQDAWGTAPLRFAPLAPTLALAYQTGRMPMTLSAPVQDPGLVTTFGPYMGIPDVDSYDVQFKVLRYITESELEQTPNRANPTVAAAHDRLQQVMRASFSAADGLFHQDFGDPPNFAAPPPQASDGGNSAYAFLSAQYYLRALPYAPADVQAAARPRLRRYFADWVLQPARFTPYQGKLLLYGPGIGTWGSYDDAGKFSSNLLITLWTYGRYTGDWALLRERWGLIQQLFVTPREASWRSYGREELAELGDQAPAALAYARLAYFVGDRDAFGYGAYLFARELTHHVVKTAGSPYFVEHQPFNNGERIPANVYLTDAWDNLAGWNLDGPGYPAGRDDQQYLNRWVRFGDPDVARFHRDRLLDLHRAELAAGLPQAQYRARTSADDPHIFPSVARVHSLLLNTPPDELARLTPVNAATDTPSGALALSMAFIRTGRPVQLTTIIPAGDLASDWARGIDRDRPADKPNLVVEAEAGAAPTLTWYGWPPPSGSDHWSFGQIVTDQPYGSAAVQRLSWNTAVIIAR